MAILDGSFMTDFGIILGRLNYASLIVDIFSERSLMLLTQAEHSSVLFLF